MSSKECSIGLKLIFGASTLSTKSKHKHRLSSQFIIISHFFVPFESIVSVHICTRCKHMSRLAFSNFENFFRWCSPSAKNNLSGRFLGKNFQMRRRSRRVPYLRPRRLQQLQLAAVRCSRGKSGKCSCLCSFSYLVALLATSSSSSSSSSSSYSSCCIHWLIMPQTNTMCPRPF